MPSPTVDQGSKPRVLVVDDEQDMLETAAAILSAEFEVLTARNGQLALSVLEKSPVQVICTDYNMPGMTGVQLLRQVGAQYPGVSAILVTGFTDIAHQEKRPGDVFLLVVKPYKPEALRDAVRRAVQYSQVKKALQNLAPDKGSD